ncbi:hypothetical protein V502_06597 [Pseudogymnoascus sp. VKM F-4520 (FW-2644)]|nr:hypothetical protein V502_06597 [Pseudogymnoascus sp. VKM F-4520 (FW-2644)]
MPLALSISKAEGKPGVVYHPLKLSNVEKRTLAQGEIQVSILTAALNHRDLFIRQSLYPAISFTTPLLADGCGVVTSGSSKLNGKRVILTPAHGWESSRLGPETFIGILGGTTMNEVGTAQEVVVVPEAEVELAPVHLNDAQAAALPLTGLTAWRALVTKTGEALEVRNILVTGIGGGVALNALQFAVAKGCNVWVTSGDEGKIGKAVALGAKEGLLKQGGVVVSYGMTSGPKIDFPMSAVLKNIDLRASTMGSREEFREMVRFVNEKKIVPVVSKVVDGLDNLEGVEGLFQDMKHGKQFGKLIIRIKKDIGSKFGSLALSHASQSDLVVLEATLVPVDQGETEHRVAALTIEYKAPHKLTLGHIYEGLAEMNLDEVVEEGENESVAIRCRRLVAAVITQGFSYMVKVGVEYGEIYTGEATIFLRIPDDPSTVYYYLSVPKGDVGASTGRAAQWILKALRQLKAWNVVVKEVEDAVADDEVPSSEYRPSPRVNQDIIRSPIQFRPRKKNQFVGTCASVTSSFSSDDDNHHPDTPSRPQPPSSRGNLNSSPNPPSQSTERGGKKGAYSEAHRQKNLGRFCTPNCLMGMVNGGELDRRCPNVEAYGKSRHQLNRNTFMQHIRELLCSQLEYCVAMNIHGARGAFFKVKLPGFGYTVAAKGTGIECVRDLMYESTIYHRLLPVQGKWVPVHLGDTEVDSILYYAGAVRIVYMMFFSFGGFQLQKPIPRTLADDAICGLHDIHQLGVLQGDPAARNILVHPDRPGITWIDFERDEFVRPRAVLGTLSPNRKRKVSWPHEEGKGQYRKGSRTHSLEIRQAKTELAKLVVKQGVVTSTDGELTRPGTRMRSGRSLIAG